MGLFRRRSEPQGAPRDPDLPLDVDRAARLRALVRTTFAERGAEVLVASDHVTDDQGTKFGLWNLAALCAEEPERAWPELVRRHVGHLTAPQPDLADLDEAELVASTYFRLIETAGVPHPDWHPGALRLGEALMAVLSVDRPDTVITPRERDWDARGGLERWRATGTANLRVLLASDELTRQRMAHGQEGGDFDVLLGDSFFTGSLALLAEEVVQRFAPGTDVSRGVLVAAPFRHQLAWRVVDGPDAAVALTHLFRFAMLGVTDAPGPLSPHVYWVRGGEWRQVTDVSGEQPAVVVDDDLAAALGMPPA